MRTLWTAVLLCLVVPGTAWGWTEAYSWAAVPGATSYRVEKSTDSGMTWITAGTVTVPAFPYTGTESGLTLFRVSAINAQGITTRTADGLWHNEAWQLPFVPQNLLAP